MPRAASPVCRRSSRCRQACRSRTAQWSSSMARFLTGGPFRMTSDMRLTYSATQPSVAPNVVGLGDEFCFGQSWGCQIASVDTSKSFANIVPIQSRFRLLALYGDMSDSTFTGGRQFGPPPRGAWGMSNDFYVIKSCAHLPKGI